MDGLRYFLESSTIHGLSYIPAAKKHARIFWVLVVIAGFTGAGIIIQKSFQSWAEGPVTTTIETNPITDLTFPKVILCVHIGTHTLILIMTS